ncbi:MAG: energy transducer TonB [Bacteroidales bacterium]|nr:energy transducer TonB [Bacteroidales bacterium]
MKVYQFVLFIILTGCIAFGHAQEQSDEEAREVVIMINDSSTSIDEDVFVVVEQMPEFPGGDEAMYKYIADTISYPEKAKKLGLQGRVFVTFVVERDGSINQARILRGIGGGCDEEALRVVQDMPKWKPGIQRGKPVRVQYNLPIKFTLSAPNDKEKCEEG